MNSCELLALVLVLIPPETHNDLIYFLLSLLGQLLYVTEGWKERVTDSRCACSTLAYLSIETGDFSNYQSSTCLTAILARKVSRK